MTCDFCRAADAAFTLDFVDDGTEVCASCLADAIRNLAAVGHEWPHVFEGQYPRYVKVTPYAEHAPDICPDCGARGEHDYDCPRVTS